MTLSDEQLQTFANLAVTRDGHILKGFLTAALQESDLALRSTEGVALHRLQGRSIFIAGLLKQFEEAEKRMKLK